MNQQTHVNKILCFLFGLLVNLSVLGQDALIVPYDTIQLTPEQQQSNPIWLFYPASMQQQIPDIHCYQPPTEQGRRIGVFSVSKEEKVTFSQGNLQYIQSRKEWRFADTQYEIIGEKNVTNNLLSDRVDLFAWSGKNTKAPFGVSLSTDVSDYTGKFVEWGDNSIHNDDPDTWRTLSKKEWEYILNTRAHAKELRFHIQVGQTPGLVLLPDTCIDIVTGLPKYDYSAFNNQTITPEQWHHLEQMGAVFLPAAGRRVGNKVSDTNEIGNYWSSTKTQTYNADYLTLTSHAVKLENIENYTVARSVRLVHDTVLPEAIDLGLSVKWATFNLGAKAPEMVGHYFAFGETRQKSYYSWPAYLWADGSAYQLNKYCTNAEYGLVDNKVILEPQDDAATVYWRDEWRTPTDQEWQELLENCTWRWVKLNGVDGYKVTSKIPGFTEKSIFLPVTGYIAGSSIAGTNSGYYASSSIFAGDPDAAWRMYLYSTSRGPSHSSNRYCGYPIRPVSGLANFTTPTVVTITPTQITQTAALFGGKVSRDGGAHVTEYGIVYSTSELPTIEDHKILGTNGIGMFFIHLTDLQPNTQYYVRAFATNKMGTTYGSTESFTTGSFSPVPYSGIDNGHAYVDLGLPSGVQWAVCNIGAASREQAGDYYAWGEVSPKETYNWSTYKWSNEDGSLLTKYNTNLTYGSIDNKTTLDAQDDAATVNWGPNWRMPTYVEHSEIRDTKYCTWIWTTINGVKGHLVTSRINGNSIFIPATGYAHGKSKSGVNMYGYYPSASLRTNAPKEVFYSFFRTSYTTSGAVSRIYGLTVRPVYGAPKISKASINTYAATDITENAAIVAGRVTYDGGANIVEHGVVYDTKSSPTLTTSQKVVSQEDLAMFYCQLTGLQKNTRYYARAYAINAKDTAYASQVSFTTVSPLVTDPTGQENGFGYVDLGLSVKWATCNLGTTVPEGTGNYYAWGETDPKDTYNWESYLWADEDTMLTKYCIHKKYGVVDNKLLLDSVDDAAYINYEGSWRMPTDEEWAELRTQCTWYWTKRNGVNGHKVVAKNGNSIFLPTTGYLLNEKAYEDGTSGYYWSKSLNIETPQYAYSLFFDASLVEKYYNGRFCGQTIRPVWKEPAPSVPAKHIGMFTIGKETIVRFSQGYLQYIQSQDQWRFAPDQLYTTGERHLTNLKRNKVEIADTVMYFAWSAHDTKAKWGISQSINAIDYQGTFLDWGTNHIHGEAQNTWRSMSNEEWVYLLTQRANAQKLVGFARIDNTNGLVILPDDWVLPDGAIFSSWADSIPNIYTIAQWQVMEDAGAVFVSAAGYFNNQSDPKMLHLNEYIYLPSSTSIDEHFQLYTLITADSISYSKVDEGSNLHYAFPRRLVHDTVLPAIQPCDSLEIGDMKFYMMCVEGGSFVMGSGSNAHRVTLSDYYIGQTEITQLQWKTIMGTLPKQEFVGDNLPVTNVSIADCQLFAQRLSQLSGRILRLPTEAEWEFAARGGKLSQGFKYAGSDYINKVAWCTEHNNQAKLQEVMLLQHNELGIYDMSGNATEWVSDWNTSPYNKYPQINPTGGAEATNKTYIRRHRGGQFRSSAATCEITARHSYYKTGANTLGLRLVMTDDELFREIYITDSVRFYMRPVKGGSFMMGASPEDSVAQDNEQPQHQVTLSDFYIAETEVTQLLWQTVMGTTLEEHYAAHSCQSGLTSLGSSYPMYMLSKADCLQFISRLNQMTGLKFRLPTEAEWEYAARGGQLSQGCRYAGSNTVDSVAWHIGNSKNKCQSVAQKMPNELGVFDMSGNVWEWVSDCSAPYISEPQVDPVGPSTGDLGVIRGGSYEYPNKEMVRVTARKTDVDTNDYRSYIGLRLVLDIQ